MLEFTHIASDLKKKKFFFKCGPFLVFIEFATILLLFYALFFLGHEARWHLSSLIGDQTPHPLPWKVKS